MAILQILAFSLSKYIFRLILFLFAFIIVNISENDSYMSIDWKGMKEIAKKQVEIIEEYEETEKIVRTKHSEISDKSEYPIPGMSHYIRYLHCQKNVK